MLNDIRYAIRALRQNRGFAFTAIISIGLAIGANSSIFGFIDALLLRPLPVPRASDVLSLRQIEPTASASGLANLSGGFSYPDFVYFKENNQSFEDLLAFHLVPAGFAPDARTQPQLRMGYVVSGNFFKVLGVKLQLGREFSADEDRVPGRDAVVILDHGFWKREFASDPSIVGRRVKLGSMDFTVIGVAPESFTGLDSFVHPAFYAPIMMAGKFPPDADVLTNRASRRFDVKGRLKSGVSIETAAREAAGLAKSLEQAYPDTNRGFGATVLTESQFRFERVPVYRMVVVSLFGLVLIVLLIACCNVANLMLGRGKSRAREIAVRLAIGASRSRLVRQLMVESLIVALAGAVVGLVVADAALNFFAATAVPVSDYPVQLAFQLDTRVLYFTLFVSVASAILFGLVPALQATKTDVAPTLKSGEQSERRKRFLGRNTLVTVQLAGSVLLSIAAFQLYRGYGYLLVGAHGFRRDHVLTMRLDPSVAGYTPAQTAQFYQTLLDRSGQIPGLLSTALTSFLPLTTDLQQKNVIPEGYEFTSDQRSASVFLSAVDDHYFDTFGVRIVAGRGFAPTDTDNSPRVAIVNNAFAQKYFGGNAVGKRLRLNGREGPWAEVVGVAVTGHYLSVAEAPTDFLFLPHTQEPLPRMTMLALSTGDPAALAVPLRDLVRSIDANMPVLSVRTMDNHFDQSASSNFYLTTTIFGSASFMGLVLALVGLYALVSYQVARRTREIGIRMALGAAQGQVMRMVLREAVVMSVVGVGIGIVLSLAAGRGLTMGRPAPFRLTLNVLVPLALMLTTLVAAAIPARRASRVDPLIALRQD
jgi:putative ABC transport system permease protein